MHYLPEKTEEILTLNIPDGLYLFDLSDNTEQIKIDNILAGKYKIFQNIVSEDIDEEGISIFSHAFILHESIAVNDLNSYTWNRKTQISFDTSVDGAYMGLFTSVTGVEDFNKQNPTFEVAVNNPDMIQIFDSGIAFSFPDADYGNKIELIKKDDYIIGFRIQGIGKELSIDIINQLQNNIKNPKNKL